MEIFLTIAALVWALIGVTVLAGAKSAIHEILAALMISFGILFIGVAGIISRVTNRESTAAPRTEPAATRLQRSL